MTLVVNAGIARVRGLSLVRDEGKAESSADIDASGAARAARDPATARKAAVVHIQNAARSALENLPEATADDTIDHSDTKENP